MFYRDGMDVDVMTCMRILSDRVITEVEYLDPQSLFN